MEEERGGFLNSLCEVLHICGRKPKTAQASTETKGLLQESREFNVEVEEKPPPDERDANVKVEEKPLRDEPDANVKEDVEVEDKALQDEHNEILTEEAVDAGVMVQSDEQDVKFTKEGAIVEEEDAIGGEESLPTSVDVEVQVLEEGESGFKMAVEERVLVANEIEVEEGDEVKQNGKNGHVRTNHGKHKRGKKHGHKNRH